MTRIALLLAVAGAGLVAAAGTTAADTPSLAAPVKGSFAGLAPPPQVTCQQVTAVRRICSVTGIRTKWSGDIVGTAVGRVWTVLDCPAGRTVGRTWGYGFETFTGSLRGGPKGTLRLRSTFDADLNCKQTFPFNGRTSATITRGRGGLAGVHGYVRYGDKSYTGLVG